MGMRGSCFSWVLSLLCSNDEPWGPQWGAGKKQRQDAVWNSPRGRQLVSSALVSHSPRPRWGATSGPHTSQDRVNYRTRHTSQPQDTPGGRRHLLVNSSHSHHPAFLLPRSIRRIHFFEFGAKDKENMSPLVKAGDPPSLPAAHCLFLPCPPPPSVPSPALSHSAWGRFVLSLP